MGQAKESLGYRKLRTFVNNLPVLDVDDKCKVLVCPVVIVGDICSEEQSFVAQTDCQLS
jgi:hypothetical protein